MTSGPAIRRGLQRVAFYRSQRPTANTTPNPVPSRMRQTQVNFYPVAEVDLGAICGGSTSWLDRALTLELFEVPGVDTDHAANFAVAQSLALAPVPDRVGHDAETLCCLFGCEDGVTPFLRAG